MDVDERGGGGMGDSGEQFHRHEAISAVVDEGFLAEEEDDYEDLYNDVNVGENFLQSLRKNEEPPAPVEKKVEVTQTPPPLPPPPPQSAPPPAVTSVGGERKVERIEDDGVGSRGGSEVYQSYKGPGGPGVLGNPGGGGFRVELTQSVNKVDVIDEQTVSNSVQNQPLMAPQHHGIVQGNMGNDNMMRQGGGNMNGMGGMVGGGIGNGGNGTLLFVGDLHWWTTDAELEEELSKYGPVKEVKFFDEKASGKSKGYCQVEFYDPNHATACKEGMNGHMFNGRPCVVAYASPYTVKKMGEAQVNRNTPGGGGVQANVNQGRRGPGEVVGNRPVGGNIATGGNYQGVADNNGRGGYGRGNWGRGNGGGGQGMGGGGGRGPVGPMRNRGGGIGGRGLMGNNGNGFGGTPPMMHPNSMMGQGFDPGFGGPMGRMGGGYGGFPGGPAPFSGMLSSFPPVGNVGLPGVAPHVNPAFFGRGMPMNGMGMMPNNGMDGGHMGMWADPNMGGWGNEDHNGGRAGESSYGEEAVSDHQYGEGPWQGQSQGGGGGIKEKDRGSERARSNSSDRRYREEKESGYDNNNNNNNNNNQREREKETPHDPDWSEKRREVVRERESNTRERERSRDRDRARSRDRHRDERDKYSDHHRYRERERERDQEYDNDWDRGRSSRTHGKSRVSHDEERSRSRDADYGKRRRVTSD